MDKRNPLIYLLGSAGCLLLALNSKQSNIGALAASLGGATMAQIAMKQSSEQFIDDEIKTIMYNTQIAKYELAAKTELIQVLPAEAQEIIDVNHQALPASTTTNNDPRFKNLASLLEMGKGIFLMAGTGCGKSSLVKFFCGEIGQIESLIVCDPHWDGKQDYGVTPHYNYDDILEQLQSAIDELDSRRELRRVGKTFSHKVYVFDEWPSIRIHAKKSKREDVCQDALIRLGSECRKYNMLAIFCSQSGNVKAAGLDGMGDFLSNFSCIRIGTNAIKYARRNSLKDELKILSTQAYPCLVDDEIYYHATHGHYQEFKDKQPPANIKQFIVGKSSEKLGDIDTTGNNIIHTETGRFDLNKEGDYEDDEGENESEPSLSPHPQAQELEAIFNEGCTNQAPQALIPDGWVPVSPKVENLSAEVRGVLVGLININCSKEEAIKLVFGCKKSGTSKSWKAASYWYDEIKSQVS